ncbi:ComEC/Rec2 family competence protein [Corynebacterium sp. 4HC-13]|uniref:ComEC/Rec2 family competence protein n=1 Tax=Corynebacterium anserum TaxID=2684406 RepID=UPI00163A8F75|nr:ComEC/Rec2 family competence protein [Corynebacterium anserum]MBC2681114.1 ComEC/Rec2 family competence protein [Corynebacterium anserum]
MSLSKPRGAARARSMVRWTHQWVDKVRHPRLERPRIVSQSIAADRDDHSPEAIRRRRGTDLRLLPVAAAVWIVVAVTVAWRSPWPAVTCAALSIVGWLMVRGADREERRRSLGRSVIASSVSASVVGLCAWWRIFLLDSTSSITALRIGQKLTITGEFPVAGTPKQLGEGRILIPIKLPDMGTVPLFVNAERARGTFAAHNLEDVQPGQLVDVAATVRWDDSVQFLPVVASATRTVEWDPQASPEGIWVLTAWLRAGLNWASDWWGGDMAGLIPGMVMGDISGQTPQVRHQFLATGLSHLTAVSGANVSIVVGTAMVMLSFFRCSPKWRVGAAMCALIGFVLLVGPEPSILRAAVMGGVGIVAVASARWSDVLAALNAAIIVLLLVAPGLAVQYAFVLSVVATAGIVALAPWLSLGTLRRWTHYCADRWHRDPTKAEVLFIRFICVTIAADVVTAPVIVLMTGRVSLSALLANMLVSAAVAPVTVIGLLASPVGAFFASIGLPHYFAGIILAPAVPCAWWILSVADTLSSLPMWLTPGGFWWALLWAIVLITVIFSLKRLRLWRIWRWAWLIQAIILGCGVDVVKGGLDEQQITQWAPSHIDVSAKTVITVDDDDAARRVSASWMEDNDQPLDLIVVKSCGRAYGRPTITQEGIPVVYPCRDGTTLVGENVE